MLKEIQYLRAIAVLMVTCVHAEFVFKALGLSPYFSLMQRTGVDIFFVISGYVVSASLFASLKLQPEASFIANLENNIDQLKAFFIKRVFRLFPVVLLLIVADLICHALFPHFGTTAVEEIMGLFSYITMQTDMDTIMHSNTYRDINHLWTLAVEERFYLVIPFLIIACNSARRFMALAIAFIVGLSMLKALYPFSPETMYFSGFLRFDAFMFGILLCLLEERTSVIKLFFGKKHNLLAMNLLTILLLIIAARLPVGGISETGIIATGGGVYYYLLVYSLSTILIAMAAQDKGYVLGIPVLRNLLAWLGERSYNIYVFQIWCLAAAHKITTVYNIENNYMLQSIIFFVILFSVSEAIYRLWELPLRNKGRSIAAQIAR